MTKAKAERLGAALVTAGILSESKPGKNMAKATTVEHGTVTIEGPWAGRDSLSGIACEHVAEALIRDGRWTVKAINACRHFRGESVKPVRLTVKRCPHTCTACQQQAA